MPLQVTADVDSYLNERLEQLHEQLNTVNRLALANELPQAIITISGLKITDLLLEVDEWTGFTSHFTHLKSGEQVKDRTLLLTAILADAINLGLTKMAESCPGSTYAKLAWQQAWHIRDRNFDQQHYRASGLTLVTAAIVLWNTVYLQRAIATMQDHGHTIEPELLQYLSPLGWDHVNLTGDFVWRNHRLRPGKFRPLRPLNAA